MTKYIKEPYDPAKSMIHFFITNPEMTVHLFADRLYKSFWMTRPFYSAKHNFSIALFLIPYYFLAIIGIAAGFNKKKLFRNLYFLSGLLIFTLPMVVFCADWVNRFMLPPFVFIFIYIALGIDFIVINFMPMSIKKYQ